MDTAHHRSRRNCSEAVIESAIDMYIVLLICTIDHSALAWKHPYQKKNLIFHQGAGNMETSAQGNYMERKTYL